MPCATSMAEILIINAPACIAAVAAAAISWSNRRRLGSAATELHEVAETVKNGHNGHSALPSDLQSRNYS